MIPNKAVEKLSVFEKVGFSSGDAACNLLFNPITMFLAFFYTDIYGINAGVVASIFLLVRIIDAFFDPLYGAMIDKTKSRWGRYRPWMLWCAVPFTISCMMMFYTPDLGPNAKIIYAFFTYLLLSLLYSAVNIPFCSLGCVITGNARERVSCQQYRCIAGAVAGLFCTFTLLPLVQYFGGGNRQTGFFWVVTLYSVLALVLFVFCFRTTRERVEPQNENNDGILTNLKNALKNDQLIVCSLGMFLDCFPSFVRGAVAIYFAKYIMHLNDWMSTLFMSLGIVAGIIGCLITPLFTRYFCKVAVYKYVKLCLVALSLALYLIDPLNQTLIFSFYFVLSVVHLTSAPILWSFVGDADDYGEWKLKKRMAGLCASSNLFTLKVSLAVSGALVGGILSFYGYVPDAAQQSESAVSGIYLLMAGIPAAGYAASWILFQFFYKLDRQTMGRIEHELFTVSEGTK